jgi:1,4-alpha-glucan branching enzyme
MIIKKGKSQVTFVFQPNGDCRKVALAGDFNDWQPDSGKMTRQKDGSFRKRLNLDPGEHRYKFWVDGEWIEDPEAERHDYNQYGTRDCIVTVG